MQEIFIQLKATTSKETDHAVEQIEAAGGRVLLVYPPRVVIAEIDPARLPALVYLAGIVSTYTDEIDPSSLKEPTNDVIQAAAAWNERLRKERRTRGREHEGRSWDAPGHLPPDPPPDVAEQIRRRGRKMKDNSDDSDDSDNDDKQED